jgi:hypothetical protein
MPQVEYLRQTYPLGGGSLTLTWAGPAIFVPGQARTILAPLFAQVGVTTAGYLVTLSKDAYHEEPMASKWTPETHIGPGLSVFAGTGTNDPVFPFLEYDVRGHWMPWGPGSAFARWAERVGVRHIRAAAASYASHDHPGRHLMPKVLQQASTVFQAGLVQAVEQAMRT